MCFLIFNINSFEQALISFLKLFIKIISVLETQVLYLIQQYFLFFIVNFFNYF